MKTNRKIAIGVHLILSFPAYFYLFAAPTQGLIHAVLVPIAMFLLLPCALVPYILHPVLAIATIPLNSYLWVRLAEPCVSGYRRRKAHAERLYHGKVSTVVIKECLWIAKHVRDSSGRSISRYPILLCILSAIAGLWFLIVALVLLLQLAVDVCDGRSDNLTSVVALALGNGVLCAAACYAHTKARSAITRRGNEHNVEPSPAAYPGRAADGLTGNAEE